MKLKQAAFLFYLLAVFSTTAFAGIEKYQDVVLSPSGPAVNSPSVTVYRAGTTTKATLYSGVSGTVSANPVTGDSSGRYSFYTESGHYDLSISRVGFLTQTKSNVCVGACGPWAAVNIADYSSIASADTYARSRGFSLVCASTYTLSSSVTVTSAMELKSGCTLTGGGSIAFVKQPIIGDYQVFGNVTVTGLKEARPEWWGGKGDNSTDNYSAFMSAVSGIPSDGGVITLSTGTYLLSSQTLTINKNNVTIKGQGRSILSGKQGATTIAKGSSVSGNAIEVIGSNVTIEKLTMNGIAGNSGDGLQVCGTRFTVKDIAVFGMGNDGIRIGDDIGCNANLWYAENIATKGNSNHGFNVRGVAVPDVNAGTLIHLDAQSNGQDGLHTENAWLNNYYNITAQTNGRYGAYFGSGANYNHVFGGDIMESNVTKDLFIDSGSVGNTIIPDYIDSAHYTDNGTDTFIESYVNTAGLRIFSGLTRILFSRNSANAIAASSVGGYLDFFTNGDTILDVNAVLRLNPDYSSVFRDNVSIGGSSFGTDSSRVLSMKTGTCPSNQVSGSVQLCSSGSGTTAIPKFKTGNNLDISLDQRIDSAATPTFLGVNLNGTGTTGLVSPIPIKAAGNAAAGRGVCADLYPPISGASTIGARVCAERESGSDTSAITFLTCISGSCTEYGRISSAGIMSLPSTTSGVLLTNSTGVISRTTGSAGMPICWKTTGTISYCESASSPCVCH